jgi:hypothetical protein
MKPTISAIVCTVCNVQMSEHRQVGSKIQYFLCPRCHRWVSSAYAEVLRADGGFKAVDKEREAERARQFQEAKAKLERFLSTLDEADPYRVLGVAPGSPIEQVRARYREAALEHHPDRGGSVAKMAEINLAFERITGQRQANARAALPTRASVASAQARPTRRYAVPAAVLDRA